jgi:hypothetical protein
MLKQAMLAKKFSLVSLLCLKFKSSKHAKMSANMLKITEEKLDLKTRND